jgi:hypothetical protein
MYPDLLCCLKNQMLRHPSPFRRFHRTKDHLTITNFSSPQTPSNIEMKPWKLTKSEYSPSFLLRSITSCVVATVLLRGPSVRIHKTACQPSYEVSRTQLTFCHSCVKTGLCTFHQLPGLSSLEQGYRTLTWVCRVALRVETRTRVENLVNRVNGPVTHS